MKAVLPWLLVFALGAVLVWQFTVTQKQQSELASARLAGEQLEALRQEFETKQQEYAGVAAELERVRKDSKDLLRLRNEVVKLRKEKEQLGQQMQTAQTQAQSAQQQAAAAQQQAESLRASAAAQPVQPTVQTEAQARFLQRYGLQQTPEQQQASACANNLRQIEGAKQQWAAEHNQAQGAPVDVAALAAYLKEVPVCPAGGSYTLGAIGTPPTCSVQGHALVIARQVGVDFLNGQPPGAAPSK